MIKMIKIVLHEVNTLKACVNAISRIVDDMEILLTTSGLEVTCMDRSHITMIHYRLDERFFSIYEVDMETGVYIDTEEFNKVLKRCGKDDELTITTEGQYLELISEGLTTKTFKVKIIDSEYNTPTLHPLDENSVALPSDLLNEVISDIQSVSEKLTIKLDKEMLIFDAPGTFIDAHIEYLHTAIVKTESRGSYNIKNIANMLKAYKVSDDVKLTFGENTPLQLDFEIDNGLGILTFFLAPVIEDG